jgi:phospholipase C
VDKMINGADTDGDTVPDGTGGRTLIDDAQPYYDDCSTRDAASLSGRNIGDNLNAAGLSWGWFQGGFRPSTSFATATGGAQPTSTFIPNQFKGKFAVKPASDHGLCNTVHPVGVAVGGIGGTAAGANNYGNKDDYIPHHEPFQYYASTTNPHHLPPASLAAIGTDTQTTIGGVPQFDKANHQYDMSDFDALVGAIAHGYLSPDHLPAVSFLKAPGYQDGHADYSDPLDEQQFIANEINALQHTPDWSSTAVIVVTTTPTAGTTTRTAASTIRRIPRLSPIHPVRRISSPVRDYAAIPQRNLPSWGSKAAAASDRAYLCWSYHRGRSTTTSTTR